MTVTLEIDDQLEAAVLVSALERQYGRERGDGREAAACLLRRLDYTQAYQAHDIDDLLAGEGQEGDR